jgi:two-component system, NtrC family, sensor kinase
MLPLDREIFPIDGENFPMTFSARGDHRPKSRAIDEPIRMAHSLPHREGPAMLLVASRTTNATALLACEPEDNVNRAALRRVALIGAMAATVAAVAGVSYWDAERESAAALQDFAQEQSTLAMALGSALRIRVATGRPIDQSEVLTEMRSVEQTSTLAILLHHPGDSTFRATNGRELASPRLVEALAAGQSVVRIPRDEAAAFGLPARTALAGLSHIGGASGTWEIVAIASAQRERDREFWARRRLVLSVFTAAGLVLAFGGLAMRTQRNELVLQRELAVASIQQRRDERLERANKAAVMGTLAMGVAHEISTPLGVIAARAEQMMPKVATDERLSAGVKASLSQTERINQVIRGLLGLARGETPSTERIYPRTLIQNAVALVEHRFEKVGVPLRQEIDPVVPTVMGDPRLLEHAVVNLLLNACDACKGGGEVIVGIQAKDGELEIAVEDTGTGISLADAGRALEPFFTTKGRDGGTGLGLAIVHEIVANHRGRLVFSNVTPRGTRAAILLPRVEGSGDV